MQDMTYDELMTLMESDDLDTRIEAYSEMIRRSQLRSYQIAVLWEST